MSNYFSQDDEKLKQSTSSDEQEYVCKRNCESFPTVSMQVQNLGQLAVRLKCPFNGAEGIKEEVKEEKETEEEVWMGRKENPVYEEEEVWMEKKDIPVYEEEEEEKRVSEDSEDDDVQKMWEQLTADAIVIERGDFINSCYRGGSSFMFENNFCRSLTDKNETTVKESKKCMDIMFKLRDRNWEEKLLERSKYEDILNTLSDLKQEEIESEDI